MTSPQFEVGQLVEVAPRTWAGINKPGGIGTVSQIHYEDGYVNCVDVGYVVGGKDTLIDVEFVKPYQYASRGSRGARQKKQPQQVAPPLKKKRKSAPSSNEVVASAPVVSRGESASTQAETPMPSVPDVIQIPQGTESQAIISPLETESGGAHFGKATVVSKKPLVSKKTKKKASSSKKQLTLSQSSSAEGKENPVAKRTKGTQSKTAKGMASKVVGLEAATNKPLTVPLGSSTANSTKFLTPKQTASTRTQERDNPTKQEQNQRKRSSAASTKNASKKLSMRQSDEQAKSVKSEKKTAQLRKTAASSKTGKSASDSTKSWTTSTQKDSTKKQYKRGCFEKRASGASSLSSRHSITPQEAAGTSTKGSNQASSNDDPKPAMLTSRRNVFMHVLSDLFRKNDGELETIQILPLINGVVSRQPDKPSPFTKEEIDLGLGFLQEQGRIMFSDNVVYFT